MPQARPYFFETTVFDQATGAEASLVSAPGDVLRQAAPEAANFLNDPQIFAPDFLNVRLGVPIPTPDDIPDVFFASLAGRVVPFDDFSFERWRAQREADDPRAQFAVELATMEFVAVEESPLNGASLTSLMTRGSAFTIGGWQAIEGHPWLGLGILIVGQFGFVVGQVIRGIGDEAYLATRYRFRRIFRTPPDWQP